MRKLKIYIETSVWNHLLAEDAPEARAATEALFREIDQYEIYISDLVFGEIDETRDAKKRKMLRDTVERYQPHVLAADDDEVITLASRYIEEKVIPPSAEDDATHVAVAVVEGLDVIVSLNMDHVASLRARRGINGVNALTGYRVIEIATPREVANYGKD
ncbi:MAG: PIN domain-containing protein [Planctomycetota bacterium]